MMSLSQPVWIIRVVLYLGVVLARRRTFTSHIQGKKSQLTFLSVRTKVWARQSMDRRRTAEAYWTSSVMPILLYGAEIVPYTKTWFKKVNAVQSVMAKWILGVNKRFSATAARGIVGWLPRPS